MALDHLILGMYYYLLIHFLSVLDHSIIEWHMLIIPYLLMFEQHIVVFTVHSNPQYFSPAPSTPPPPSSQYHRPFLRFFIAS